MIFISDPNSRGYNQPILVPRLRFWSQGHSPKLTGGQTKKVKVVGSTKMQSTKKGDFCGILRVFFGS